MPYINDEGQEYIRVTKPGEHNLDDIGALQHRLRSVDRGKRKGAVNYVISRLVLGAFQPKSYHDISDAVSVLRDAAAEIERRLMGPREDVAIAKNGDLPEYEDLLGSS